jgi:hypothetical protein
MREALFPGPSRMGAAGIQRPPAPGLEEIMSRTVSRTALISAPERTHGQLKQRAGTRSRVRSGLINRVRKVRFLPEGIFDSCAEG